MTPRGVLVRLDFTPLRELRTGLGISQQQLAESAGVNSHTVRRTECNVTEPTLALVLAYARALGVPHDRLYRVVS